MDSLTPDEQARLQALRRTDAFVSDTLEQLDRILASRKFERVQRNAKEFMLFVVAKKLLGETDHVKEMTIAIAVFQESADFDPDENAKVRVAGADLRERLVEYREEEGRGDPLEIIIPTGTYVPEIRDRRISVAVSTFENWHPQNDQEFLCGTMSDEIVYLLNLDRQVRAKRVAELDVGVHQRGYGLRGSLEHQGDLLHVNMSLANLSTGRIVCWRSFEERRDNLLKLSRDVTDVLLNALHSHDRNPVQVARRKRPM